MSKRCGHCDKTWGELDRVSPADLRQHKAVACGCADCKRAAGVGKELPEPNWDKLGISSPGGKKGIDWDKRGPQKV